MPKKRDAARVNPLRMNLADQIGRAQETPATSTPDTAAGSAPEPATPQPTAVVEIEATPPPAEVSPKSDRLPQDTPDPAGSEPPRTGRRRSSGGGGHAAPAAERPAPQGFSEDRRPTRRRRERSVDPRPAHRRQPKTKDTLQIKTRVTAQEADAIDELRMKLELKIGAKLMGSEIMRALLMILLRVDDELDTVRAPEMVRPSYGDSMSLAEFEDEIAAYLLALIKRTRRMD